MTVITDPTTSRHLQRLLEIIFGSLAWLFLLGLVVLSWFSIIAAAYVLIGYTFLWLIKISGYSLRLVRGYIKMRLSQQVDWQLRLADLADPAAAMDKLDRRLAGRATGLKQPGLRYYRGWLAQAVARRDDLMTDIYHAVIIAVYNESRDIIESTVRSVLESHYDKSRMILIIAYEERGGSSTRRNAQAVIDRYAQQFKYAAAIKHPADIPGEVKAKAGNITWAARRLTKYIESQSIVPEQVLVTTLDADNRPDPQYFAKLSYMYAITPRRTRRSYQPIPMFFNNIWDAPALMRVIAVSNSFWVLMESLRPNRLRNFSAHAQSLHTLIDTDYWNVRSIVEDGHQYWRTYFTYDGDHQVLPVFLPIYQDAVLTNSYWKTFKAQFYQLRRWAWGVSDTPYVIIRSWRAHQISLSNKLSKIAQQIEGYFSWAAAPIVLAVGGWVPLLLNTEAQRSIVAQQLPSIVSWIQTFALIGLLMPIVSMLLSLPPRPPRYRRRRSIMMVLQWAFVPLTLIGFGSFAALNAQTRLLFGRYLGEFNVTEKRRVSAPAAIKRG